MKGTKIFFITLMTAMLIYPVVLYADDEQAAPKQESSGIIISIYRAIEDGVVSGYKAIENFFISIYQAIENRFIETSRAVNGNQTGEQDEQDNGE